jgi:hypothetical protein
VTPFEAMPLDGLEAATAPDLAAEVIQPLGSRTSALDESRCDVTVDRIGCIPEASGCRTASARARMVGKQRQQASLAQSEPGALVFHGGRDPVP